MKKFNVTAFIVGLIAWILCALFLFLGALTFVISASKNGDVKKAFTETKAKIVSLLDE